MLVLSVDAFVRGGVGMGLLLLPWMLLIAWCAYVGVYVSCIRTDAHGITIVNGLRRTFVPWPRVTGIDMRWLVEVTSNDRTPVKAFGGPVTSRPRPRRAGGEPRVSSAVDDVALLQRDWETGLRTGGSGGSSQRSWDVPALGALGGILIAVAVALVVSRAA